jgi:hypothetical protein
MWKNILFLRLNMDSYMHWKRTLVIFSLVLLGANAVSQHLSHKVLVSAANVVSAGDINLAQTIGEAVVATVGNDGYDLTQGFQQPRFVLSLTSAPEGTGVKVYPNPSTYYVNIEFFGETSRAFSISIFNINGTIVYTQDLNFNDRYWYIQEIPVTSLARGFYFIRVISKDGVINRTFKMEKM